MRHVLRLHYFNTLTLAAIFLPRRRHTLHRTLTRPSNGLFTTTVTGRLDESHRVGGSVVRSVELTGAPFRSAPAIWSASADLGSTDLLVGPLTALTATRIQYGCTVVQICAERMRPLDPLLASSTVRSYCEPQDRRSMNASAHACRESAGERWMTIGECGFCCCCGSSSGAAG